MHSSSRKLTFRLGAFRGWSVYIAASTVDGRYVSALVQIETPEQPSGRTLDGILSFLPDTPGFDVATRPFDVGVGDGPDAMRAVLTWVVEETALALASRTDVPADRRAHWQTIVDLADHARADHYATTTV